jgi:hypothetical protein
MSIPRRVRWELALFEDKLREGVLEAGACEHEIREARGGQPKHG